MSELPKSMRNEPDTSTLQQPQLDVDIQFPGSMPLGEGVKDDPQPQFEVEENKYENYVVTNNDKDKIEVKSGKDDLDSEKSAKSDDESGSESEKSEKSEKDKKVLKIQNMIFEFYLPFYLNF